MGNGNIIYTCGRCGVYKTSRRTDIHRHLNRKKKCVARTTKEPQKNHKRTTNDKKEPQRTTKEWQCVHCNKYFSTNSHMNRHIRLYCKKKGTVDESSNRSTLHSNHVNNINISNNINIVNHNTVNNTNHNTMNNTININAHGEEDITHLKTTIMFMLSYFTRDAITDLISCTYFDPEHPENKTVRIPNKKEKWAQIYNGNEWEFRQKKDIILKVLKDSYYKLAMHFMNNKLDLPQNSHMIWSSIENPWLDKKILATTEQILLNQKQTENLNEIKEFMKRKKSLL